MLSYKKPTPSTIYKTDFGSPEASGDVDFFRHPRLPVNNNQVRYDRNMKSHYDSTNSKLLEDVKRRRKFHQSYDFSRDNRKFLLSADLEETKF